jgi:hypothetical protein
MKKALELLPPVGTVSVTRERHLELDASSNVLQSQGYVWTIEFLTHFSDLAESASANELLVSTHATALAPSFATSATAGTLTGTTGVALAARTIVRGFAGYEHQTVSTGISNGQGSLTGTFTLTFDGKTTSPLKHDASAAEIRTALEGLGNTGTLVVRRRVRLINDVAFEKGFVWTVVFKSRLGNVPQLTGSTLQLVCSDTAATATLLVNDASAPGVEGRLPPMTSSLAGSKVLSGVEIAASGTVSYKIPGLTKGTAYHVRVSAWNGVGEAYGKTMYSTPALASPASSPEPPV